MQIALFQGFSNVAKGLMKLGLLSDEPVANLHPTGREKTWVSKFCSPLFFFLSYIHLAQDLLVSKTKCDSSFCMKRTAVW